jgi:hypothetical protein
MPNDWAWCPHLDSSGQWWIDDEKVSLVVLSESEQQTYIDTQKRRVE